MKNFNSIICLVILAISTIPAKALFDNDPIAIVHIKVNEVSESEGTVSTENKKFRVIVDHNPNYIAAQDKDLYNENSSPIIRNLSILKRDLNRPQKNLKNITSDFDFEQENDSFNSPEHDGFLRTTFISNNHIIKKAQRLTFKIDLANYLRSIGVSLFSNIDANDIFRLDIEALKIEFSNLNLENDSLSFISTNPEKTKSIYYTDNLNLLGTFTSSINLSDVIKQLKFKTTSDNDKKTVAKLKKDGTKLKDLQLKVNADNGNISLNTNGDSIYRMVLPISFETKEKIDIKKLSLFENYDLLVIPVILDLKSGDNLDVNINGTLRKTVDPNFIQ